MTAESKQEIIGFRRQQFEIQHSVVGKNCIQAASKFIKKTKDK